MTIAVNMVHIQLTAMFSNKTTLLTEFPFQQSVLTYLTVVPIFFLITSTTNCLVQLSAIFFAFTI